MKDRMLRFAVVLLLVAQLAAGTPIYAQGQGQGSSQNPVTAVATTTVPARKIDLGRDYSKGRSWFPRVWQPYVPISVSRPPLTNSPRIDQLIEDGKLMLSLQDAVSLGLENNLDISVQRYVPWLAETDILRTKGGGVARGVSGVGTAEVLGSIPSTSFDPVVTTNYNWSRNTIPVNNPFLSGTGTSTLSGLINYNENANFGYSQGFHTGSAFSLTLNNNRQSTSSPSTFLNPSVQSTMTLNVQQQLLNGFGLLPNTRFILEAKNSRIAADYSFLTQVIASISQVQTQYWQLVFARENVNVQQAALATSQKLYEDNKRQLEIGTLAPLDVLTAESEVATDTQNVIVAQTNQLQQQTLLLNLISKDPMAANLQGIEIVPTTKIENLPALPEMNLPDAVKEAWGNRPELKQAELNLKNAGIEVRATRNALLPTLTAFGQYSLTGLGGNTVTTNTTTTGFAANTSQPIVNNAGQQVMVNGQNVFTSSPILLVTGTNRTLGGVGDALQNLINSNFLGYAVGMSLSIPIRNRQAQADSARALLSERQQETQYRQEENTIVVDVRNAMIAVQQGQAQVAAAQKARQLAQQTLEDEQKKYQLGASTSYDIVLRSRDLTTAQGNELQAEINLEVAMVNLNKAMGRTLQNNNITLGDARRGHISSPPLIPGTPGSDVDASVAYGQDQN